MYFFIIFTQIKLNIKTKLLELYGWSGSISVIVAYSLITIDSENYLLIDILNLYGSLAIGIMCYRASVWQATILEIAWFLVGTYSLIKNIIEEKNTTNCH